MLAHWTFDNIYWFLAEWLIITVTLSCSILHGVFFCVVQSRSILIVLDRRNVVECKLARRRSIDFSTVMEQTISRCRWLFRNQTFHHLWHEGPVNLGLIFWLRKGRYYAWQSRNDVQSYYYFIPINRKLKQEHMQAASTFLRHFSAQYQKVGWQRLVVENTFSLLVTE